MWDDKWHEIEVNNKLFNDFTDAMDDNHMLLVFICYLVIFWKFIVIVTLNFASCNKYECDK